MSNQRLRSTVTDSFAVNIDNNFVLVFLTDTCKIIKKVIAKGNLRSYLMLNPQVTSNKTFLSDFILNLPNGAKRGFLKKNFACLHSTVPLLINDLVSTFLSSITENKINWSRDLGRKSGMGQMEMRYNLATKVMRNGVEVIVATDRNARPIEPEYLRLLSSTITRPITLAPHTLTNLMSMVLPTDHVDDDQNKLLSFLQPTFVTKTYYTTYNFLTTVLKNNTTSVSNTKTIVTNVKTEQYSKSIPSENIVQPTTAEFSYIKTSPTFQTEIFQTAYTYLNTFLDGDQPLVMTSTQEISNTVIGTEESLVELEPSMVFPTTNTYLKTVEFTKTLTDGTDYHIISTKDVVTQVVVTDKPETKSANLPITTDVTKTYFVTYTYFSTYLDGDKTKVKSDVSVSSDVTIEKFYIKPKKTEIKSSEKIIKTKTSSKVTPTAFPFSIVATKTYLTTFTYFTTLLEGPNSENAETKVNSRTKVVENTVTETVPLQDLNPEYLMKLNSSVNQITGALIATATLKRGDTIVITAHRSPSFVNSYQKYAIKPTKTSFESISMTEMNKIVKEKLEPTFTSEFHKSSFVQTATKNSLPYKQKIKPTKTVINDVTAEALVASEQESDTIESTPTISQPTSSVALNHKGEGTQQTFYTKSSIALPTSTQAPQEANIETESQLNSITNDSKESNNELNSDSAHKKQTLKQPNNPMNVSNLLNLNKLGINGINVLGPVFNAMAELIHNNLNTKVDVLSKRNDTVAPSIKNEEVTKKPISTNINPLLSFMNNFTPAETKGTSEPKVKVTTPRTPVYIPVGSFAQDSDFIEDQEGQLVITGDQIDRNDKWTNTQAKNFEKVRSPETPITILEGGIPISPGQVITTNSDVIIGRPGETGPRPPKFALKNNVPVDMKPPPPPHVFLKNEDEDQYLGQQTTSQGVGFDSSKNEFSIIPPRQPFPPPKKHHHESLSLKQVRPHSHDRLKGSGHHKNTHFGKHTHYNYDSGAMDLNPPPVPPPPDRSHDVHRPITINHEPESDYSTSNEAPVNILSIPMHLEPNQNVKNYINPAEINPPVIALPTPPIVGSVIQENILPLISEPTPNVDILNSNGVLLIPSVAHIPLNFVATSSQNFVDRSTGQQLLVNIQPSQVANIVIPHGSSAPLIVSGGKQHSLKGEVIDDPSPHPEPETVGFVGAEPVLKIENEDVTTSLLNEVVPAASAEVVKQSPYKNQVLFSNRPELTTELIKIRPKPTFGNAKPYDQQVLHSPNAGFKQHSLHLNLADNQFNHQPRPISQISRAPVSIPHQFGSSFAENHRLSDNFNNKNHDINLKQNHRYEDVKEAEEISLNQNHNNWVQNSDKGVNIELFTGQNYRKEEQNLNYGANFFNNVAVPVPVPGLHQEPGSIFINHQSGANQNIKQSHLSVANNINADQSKFIQGHNLVKNSNGIYVDISPPGHLPPRPDINHLHESHTSIKHHSVVNENLSNHQSGLVHDVPLNVQVQLGSSHIKENPLKEILIGANANKHDTVYDTKQKPLDSKFSDNQIHSKRPIIDLSENLSPPPLPHEANKRPPRPPFASLRPTTPIQRFPSHVKPKIPQPADFMVPPPKVTKLPLHKPHSEPQSRPLIPVGAAGGTHQNYPNPRPEDIVIVPHKNRPESSGASYLTKVKHESHTQTSNIYPDLDIQTDYEPVKSEYDEELQESISRPLFPGQLPAELQNFNTSKNHFSAHKNIGNAIKTKPIQTSTLKENKDQAQHNERPKLEGNPLGNKNRGSVKYGAQVPSRESTQWSNGHKQNIGGIALGVNKFSPKLNDSSYYAPAKRPSGFVTANKSEVLVDHTKESSGITNHKGITEFNHKNVIQFENHRENFNTGNHKEDVASFESVKLSPGHTISVKKNITKIGPYKTPSGFVINNNNHHNTLKIHAVGPNLLPSGFVKNHHDDEKKLETEEGSAELHTEETNQGTAVYGATDTGKFKTQIKQDTSEFWELNNKDTSKDELTVYQDKDTSIASNDDDEKTTETASDKNLESHRVTSELNRHTNVSIKNGGFIGFVNNNRSVVGNSKDGDKVELQTSGKIGGFVHDSKISGTSNSSSETADFEFNKFSHSNANTESHNTGSKTPERYPSFDVVIGQNIAAVKRPTQFDNKKEDLSKINESYDHKENSPHSETNKKHSPHRYSGPNVNAAHSSDSSKDSSGYTNKNESSVSFGTASEQIYENKTTHFYEPKPEFNINEEREVAYNNAESNADEWFASKFGENNGNFVKNVKPIKTNKLNPNSPQRNVTSLTNTALVTESDIRVPPPTIFKHGDMKSKPEEVMGLSPPPLERPRRPQRPQRPKPPYKFEIPTTPKSTLTPIAIENDFPPVRTPEFNRKPIKPQDIFPPRLPDNFVHHIPEFPVRNIPRPRPHETPATSLPIDIPEITQKFTETYPFNFENNGERDAHFSGSEINGHSKPILESDSGLTSMRPPPPPPPAPPQSPPVSIKQKPVIHPKPSTIYQQPTKIKQSEILKPKVNPSQTQQKTVAPSKTEEILPTSTLSASTKSTFSTKISTLVTPTETSKYPKQETTDITGSETILRLDSSSGYTTPKLSDVVSKKSFVTTLISTGSTTIFANLFTPKPQDIEFTTKIGTASDVDENADGIQLTHHQATLITPTKTIETVHTTTLTVTSTMTTVVHSIGHKPLTKTIVLTKTLISTVFNKVTETKTLVKPTTATIIQTHTIATTKTALVVPTAIYPSQTKYSGGGTLKPEIFMADPHAKDTITISVSSSMNNNKNGEDNRKPGNTRLGSSDKDSILVVMSNKHPNMEMADNDNDHLGAVGDEENEINDSGVMMGGVFDANEKKDFKEMRKEVECSPGCKAKRNELCQRIEGVMKCVCRPGFARMFPDRPCRPTYTYNVKLMLEKLGSDELSFEKNFAQPSSTNMVKLTSATKEGLDRMIMQSDLRDVYHGVVVNGFQEKEKKMMVDFYVQLSENTNETKLMDTFKKTLVTSNYSLGGTELFAAREADNLNAEDFNECLNSNFHDCSENARCFNLKGTYTCSCKEGFTDLSENSLFPGRICSDMIGCEYCGYHGACYSKGEGLITCECFQWYSGERCHINLKVLLIALVTIGAILLALLLVCALLTCFNRRSRCSTASRTNGSSAGYLRYKGPSSQSLDRRAMIGDSSSESSVDNLPYICPPPLPSSGAGKKKPAIKHLKGPAPRPAPPAGMEQRDRSVTVMIPRAKYRPMPPLSPHLTMSTFSPDKHLSKTAAQIATEQKLISYLDGNTRQEERTLANASQNNRQTKEQQKSYAKESPKLAEKKKEPRVFEYEYKISNMLFSEETNSTDKKSVKSGDDRFRRHSDSTHINSEHSNRNSQFRKYSAGALVSAGYEVSAKVGMHHLEEDTTEDDQSAVINSYTLKSTRSQFTTLNRTGDHKTMSEARSYDETTVHPPTRSLKTHYSGSSPSSRVNNDEGHTMIERDLGSTFIMPESQLFKPEADRGSDISNFDSL